LKRSFASLPTATAVLTVASLAITMFAQTPQAAAPVQPQAGGPPPPARVYPAPTNLKVLPKNLTGQQVHEIMEQWEGSLGAHCNTCHTADPKNLDPRGRPRLNFADDSKQEKLTARLMYTMTEDINVNYVSKVPSSDVAVTCGTCHRGHLGPEPFVIPEDDHGRPAGQAPGAAPQPK
jgi:hypothetical protein